MDHLSYKTKSARKEDVQRNWYIIDAEGEIVGRLCTKIAHVLRGKHKPEYTPHVDTGDYIVVLNAKEVHVTGKKRSKKIYHRHTGYPGGLKSISFEKMQELAPEKIIQLAVKGMLPRNPLGRSMFRKLKVYPGADHPHAAQKPVELTLDKS